ncbi:MAG: DUF2299 family protein [Candidatus Lokiarchaeota archaeon]|nr:DUF2299 family protein [Candidatus Lokiarchaeota archaeon]
MDNNNQDIQNLIKIYLEQEGLLEKTIEEPDIKFGFQFNYPFSKDLSYQNNQSIVLYQPINKDFLIISISTQISKHHSKMLLNDLNRKYQFFLDIKKIILIKNLFFRIDTRNDRYEISDQIFLESIKQISKNEFYKIVRKLYNIHVYCYLILIEYCVDRSNIEDIKKLEEFDSNLGSNLYI